MGRVAGIRVGVNWSVLVVFWLICSSLATALLPQQVPGASAAAYWAAGVATAALFFASLLAHELGHAVLARRAGLRVDGITLWLLGGVTKLSGEAADPTTEARIAGVGPLISLAVAAAATLAAAAVTALGLPRLSAAALAWLGRINLLLAVFNLIPAAPLDGGRVLRAVLWRRGGDRQRAALTAARMGRLLGYLLLAVGLAEFAVIANPGGLWFALLGWFLLGAAQAEEAAARLREALAGVQVGAVMTPDPIVGPAWLTVDAFLEGFVPRHRYAAYAAYPLRSFDGTLVGMVTLARLQAVPPARRPTTRVEALMRPLAEVPVTAPEELLLDLLPRLASGRDGGRALVIQDGQLVGILSPSDLTRALQPAAPHHPAA